MQSTTEDMDVGDMDVGDMDVGDMDVGDMNYGDIDDGDEVSFRESYRKCHQLYPALKLVHYEPCLHLLSFEMIKSSLMGKIPKINAPKYSNEQRSLLPKILLVSSS